MRILVTRPEPDASALAKRLASLGHQVMVEPLLIAEPEPVDDLELDGLQALIATSRNGVRALGRKSDIDQAFDTPMFAVGPGTAGSARALGFRSVIEGPSAGRELVALIALQADVNGEPLMLLAGNVKAYDVAGELRALGFHVLEPQVYAMSTATQLGPATLSAIGQGGIDAVLLFSPATARTWAALVTRHGIEAKIAAIKHLCLSEAVAHGLGGLRPADVACAIQPNLEQMLALIARAAPQSS